jgi:hypothetical protein
MDSDRESLLEYLGWSRSPDLLGSRCFHASNLGNLPIIVSYPSLLLCYLCIYIPYGIFRYCLVVYTVLCIGDHLCSGTQCDDCTDPSKAFSLWHMAAEGPRHSHQWGVRGIVYARSAPRPYELFVLPAGVTVLFGLHNPPHSWTGTMGPSLPGVTITPCVDSLQCYRSNRRPKYILQDSPKV